MLRASTKAIGRIGSRSASVFTGIQKDVNVGGENQKYFDLTSFGSQYKALPLCVKVLLESAVRNCDNFLVDENDVNTILDWGKHQGKSEIPFIPARVVLQDFTGVPAVVDLAAMRECVQRLGAPANEINPLVPVDLVIDHSVQVDFFGTPDAGKKNHELEFQRNIERFRFLKWGSKAFDGLQIIPPGSGIVHQVNLEYLARVVFAQNNTLYPDSLVGTDSHTTMINGLGILGWGVGGIEAEAAMLGQPIRMVLPEVVGFRLTGKMREGVTATDLVLTCTNKLRDHGVVGKFVEFFGTGLTNLSLADRATISNMAPEYGATMGFFPVDDMACKYLQDSGRDARMIERVQKYLKSINMYGVEADQESIQYTSLLELDLGDVVPCLAGPKRPQDRVALQDLKEEFASCLVAPPGHKGFGVKQSKLQDTASFVYDGREYTIDHSSVVIAAVTSCTNTSNPSVMLAAGLLARNAVAKGLKVKPYVKTSLSPGSGVVEQYFRKSGLLEPLQDIGFCLTGFGCMTCIGNSGDLPKEVSEAMAEKGLTTAAVLSGNRNFEARIHPQVGAAYLASPPLVVAYALASTLNINFDTDPIGTGSDGKAVYLREIWPTNQEIQEVISKSINAEMFKQIYGNIQTANSLWNELEAPTGDSYAWDDASTYIHNPPFFQDFSLDIKPTSTVKNAACLLVLGDSVTTDHISPAGRIAETSPAGQFLVSRGVARADFNSYGSRRGNDLVMTRGTFANVKISNKLASKTGPFTKFIPTGEEMFIFDAAEAYKKQGTPMIVLAGKEYGTGSSRDWAAKGTNLLGIKIVIAQSYERIHRSNLVGMGVIPLQFKEGQNAKSLGLTGTESFSLDIGDVDSVTPLQEVTVQAGDKTFQAILRFDTPVEVQYYKHGGILNYVLRNKLSPPQQ